MSEQAETSPVGPPRPDMADAIEIQLALVGGPMTPATLQLRLEAICHRAGVDPGFALPKLAALHREHHKERYVQIHPLIAVVVVNSNTDVGVTTTLAVVRTPTGFSWKDEISTARFARNVRPDRVRVTGFFATRWARGDRV